MICIQLSANKTVRTRAIKPSPQGKEGSRSVALREEGELVKKLE